MMQRSLCFPGFGAGTAVFRAQRKQSREEAGLQRVPLPPSPTLLFLPLFHLQLNSSLCCSCSLAVCRTQTTAVVVPRMVIRVYIASSSGSTAVRRVGRLPLFSYTPISCCPRTVKLQKFIWAAAPSEDTRVFHPSSPSLSFLCCFDFVFPWSLALFAL